jgi:MYXO-CTERM domain-containing protein
MSNMAKRLDVHFAALAAVGAVGAMGAAQQAEAAVVWSGIVNLNITSSTNGLYLNVTNGANNQPGSTGGSTVPGWDVNPYSSTSLIYFNPTTPTGGVYVIGGGTGTAPANLVPGTLISAASAFGSGTAPTTGTLPHVLNSDQNLIGFRFQDESDGNAIKYGWFRVSLSTSLSAQPRTLVEYAYESTAGVGIAAGVPAPSAGMGALALGAVGLLRRRRK